jgi:hypothetical protein
MLRSSKKYEEEGKVISWPLLTYLWGILITLPLCLIVVVVNQSTITVESSDLKSAIQIAAGLPLFVLHLGFGFAFSVLWMLNIFNPRLHASKRHKS